MLAGHVTRVRKLYKLILRLHRNLPDDLRVLGDLYTKEEFKRHKTCKPQEAHTFLSEWQDYAASMLRQASPTRAQHPGRVPRNREENVRFGDDLPYECFNSMTPDQLYNLYILLVNARGDDVEEPIDVGIDLLEADSYANKIEKAKKYINELEKIEKEKIARGEIKDSDITLQTDVWLNLFDIAVSGHDKLENLLSSKAERADKAKMEEGQANKEAGQAKKEGNDN